MYHISRTASRMSGWVAERNIPVFIRPHLFKLFGWKYNVNFEELTQSLDQFATLNEFFTREILPRNIVKNENHLLSPADSKVLSFGEVKSDDVFLVKGKTYSLSELLTG